MSTPTSRYADQPTWTTTWGGRVVTAVRPRRPAPAPPVGYHALAAGERLDSLAANYLDDPFGFWRICETNDAMVPAALLTHPMIAIPAERG